MQFYSTNGKSQPASLSEAILRGLAPDGGLYMPQSIPVIPKAFFNNISDMSIGDISYVVANILLGSDLPSSELRKIVTETFTFDIPLVKVTDRIHSLELFHGPTLAFKDVGARFLARLAAHFTSGLNVDTLNVLVATSGDSGGAVAAGFHRVKGVRVFVLYPSETLSKMQERQFTTLGGNVYPIEVNGTFDDCQTMVKEAFTDTDLRSRMLLTSANSINIGRLLPQMFYYFHAYSQLLKATPYNKEPEVVIGVPCGNLGNLTAGLMAKSMGLPVKRFAAANNSNDAFARFLRDGKLNVRHSIRTIANAMDVGNPSNIKRIMDLYGSDFRRLTGDVEGFSYTDDEIASTMAEIFRDKGYILDPHGATAFRSLQDSLKGDEWGIFLETAHPSKFAVRVNRVLGLNLTNPADKLTPAAGTSHKKISGRYAALKNYLIQTTESAE